MVLDWAARMHGRIMESGADGVWHPMPPVDASIPSVAAPPRQGGAARLAVEAAGQAAGAHVAGDADDVADRFTGTAGDLDAAGSTALWRAWKFMFCTLLLNAIRRMAVTATSTLSSVRLKPRWPWRAFMGIPGKCCV